MENTTTISRLKKEIEELTSHHQKTLDESNRVHFEREINLRKQLIKAYEEKSSK
jgi:regulator of replication initiation timing